MTFSEDLRLRAVILYSFHGLPLAETAALLSVSESSVVQWTGKDLQVLLVNQGLEMASIQVTYSSATVLFNKTGSVLPKKGTERKTKWPLEVIEYVSQYAQTHPCFLLEELQESLKDQFPDLENVSLSTICRALRHDLKLSRKMLTKRAREALPQEIEDFKARLTPWYLYREQLVFVDETSKDGRAAVRAHAWSMIGSPAFVTLPFARGKRLSAMAVFSCRGFIDWDIIE
ncbi:hypothetical protein DFQ26_002016, partial [Actinomortierella ambigua]